MDYKAEDMLPPHCYKSESDLFTNTINLEAREAKRASMDCIREHAFDEQSVLFLIKIQQHVIDSYKSQLKETKVELNQCKNNIECIKTCNNFDVNQLTNNLIQNEEDKAQFKNAVLFMKNRLDYILNQIDSKN